MEGILKREDVPVERKWALEDILSENELPAMFEKAEKAADEVAKFRGAIDAERAIDCLKFVSETEFVIERAMAYLNMKSDEDKSDDKYNELLDRLAFLAVRFESACAFIEPALCALKASTLIEMRDSEKYSAHSVALDRLIRQKKHLLSEKEEKLLAGAGAFAGDFHAAFSMFDDVDADFGEIEYKGAMRPLSHGLYAMCVQEPDQAYRRAAYEQYYAAYMKHIHVLAATYGGNVKKNHFYAKARKYGSCLEMALYSENVPTKVYDNLIESVNANIGWLHRYVEHRKKALGLKDMYMSDMHCPIVPKYELSLDYDDAFKLVTEALAPLGAEYVDTLLLAKSGRWLDVEETANKRSGAYSCGAYGTHPYVLLNYKSTTSNVFTIAHEMGHAMHSYRSNRAQVYEKSQYCIFLAEIASTVNEVLLLKHLLKTAEGDMRKYLLSYYVDMFRTTVFRQTMFAEFEKFAHETIESGEALSSDKMCECYSALNRKYYGDAVLTDKQIGCEWARIPHFYRAFYVYKYATGLICAANIADGILRSPGFVDKYMRFLDSGDSRTPMDTLKLLDIDLTKKAAFRFAMSEFRSALAELERTGRRSGE